MNNAANTTDRRLPENAPQRNVIDWAWECLARLQETAEECKAHREHLDAVLAEMDREEAARKAA